MFDVFFQAAAWLIDTFYDWVGEYTVAIAMVSVAIMLLITPLTLKSTKGMLEMQRLQPEMKRLQNEHRGDRQQLNQEMMKLYQEHKVNPLASCLPLLAQMPVFIIMFQVLSGLTRKGADGTFDPKYIPEDTALFQSLDKATEMLSFGLNLAVTPAEAMGDDFVKGLPYALLIVALGGLFFVQQRMVASRAVSPTMSPMQAKIMQYLPVAFAVFQVFLPTSLVAYYMVQAIFRIVQQGYITRRFYGENGLGRAAQEASAKAREIGKDDSAKPSKQKNEQKQAPTAIQSKRVTPGKNRPTPSGRPARPVPPSKRNK
jgi:YidC/Oxa1 family membrane protein insertase